MNRAEVSGKAFLGIISYVKQQRGADFLRAQVARCAEPTQLVFASPIRALDWHPYDAYSSFLTQLDGSMGKGDGRFCRTLGAAAGKRDLGTIFKVYVALASAERLIRSCEKIWPSYHKNAGAMKAITWDPKDTRLRITGFPEMTPSHCRLMEGWMASTMETIGFRVGPDAGETTCTSKGGAFHEFACTWEKAQ